MQPLNVRDLLHPEALDRFKYLNDQIWNDLVEAHTNLAIINARMQYPPKLLGGAMELFGWYDYQLHWITALIVNRVCIDTAGDLVTLSMLERFSKEHVRPEYSSVVTEQLNRAAKRTRVERQALDNIEHHRKYQIAHTKDKSRLSDAEQAFGLTLAELQSGVDFMTRRFRACNGQQHFIFELAEVVGPVSQLLDSCVLGSLWSKQYDAEPETWHGFWGNIITAEELAVLNTVRVRHGLPVIPPAP